MSSIIAVSVSFIGLALVLVNAVIFIQMILSFPAMLSSNSQAYVQQQRKYHHIPSLEALDSSHLATSAIDDAEADTETEAEAEAEQEWEADESVVDRWIDDVDEKTNDCSPEVHRVQRHRRANLVRGVEPMTRGRPLRRQRRRHISRAVFRFKDDLDPEDDEDDYHMARESSRDQVDRRSNCVKGWRSVEWTR